MDPVQIHLLLNHIPAAGSLAALLLLAWGLTRRNVPVTVIALAGVVLVGLVAVVVFLTGSMLEARVEQLHPVSQAVERHADAAVATMVGLMSASAIAMAALIGWLTNRKLSRFAANAVLVFGVAALVLAVRTASLAGQIGKVEAEGASIISSRGQSLSP